ncbi:MAG: N-acetyl-gamma-glutamyl-phosphate reductase [Anaerolineae bacterium]
MLEVGIFGATGYTGYELVKILRSHPEAQISFATSESYIGQKLSDVFPCPHEIELISSDEAALDEVDVAFLCLPHAASMEWVARVCAAGVRAIDLSADFRLKDAAVYERWYKTTHTAQSLLQEAVYGLPELYRDKIKEARLVANPGCYPTSVILALYPVAARRLLASKRIIIDSKSGVSGAGRGLTLTTHFVEANENLSPYSIGHSHRHISEMEQELDAAGGGPYQVIFSPHLVPLNRGILSTIYVDVRADCAPKDLLALYRDFYRDEPFVHILPEGRLASLSYVVGTNRCAISIAPVDVPAGKNAESYPCIIVSAIDNLLKGASGQAVQNMNVMFGLEETMGLIS